MTDQLTATTAEPTVVGRISHATVTIDRPDRSTLASRRCGDNSLGTKRSVATCPTGSVVVLVGAGHGFGAGADIDELPDDPDECHQVHLRAELEIARCPKPVIVAINGHRVGGGCETAVAADLRFGIPRRPAAGVPTLRRRRR